MNSAAAFSIDDVVDEASRAVQDVPLQPATYIPSLMTLGIAKVRSAALGRPIAHRQGLTEDLLVDICTGSAVRIVLVSHSSARPTMYVGEHISEGSEPNLFDRFVAVAASTSERP